MEDLKEYYTIHDIIEDTYKRDYVYKIENSDSVFNYKGYIGEVWIRGDVLISWNGKVKRLLKHEKSRKVRGYSTKIIKEVIQEYINRWGL